MKKVIILGAGVYQVPLIKKARSMGFHTIVLSIAGDYPGFALADEYYYVNTTAKEEVLKVARENNVDAICTTGTDVAVATIGYVNDEMGLHGISSKAALRTNDKLEMQKCFHAGGVNSADFKAVTNEEETLAAAAEISYPVVVKCVDSSGSRGVNTANNDEEAVAAFREAIRYSRKPYVLVEEKLVGDELCISGFIQDGKLAFLAPHHKYITGRSKVPISVGHSFPCHLEPEALANVERQLQLIIDALEVDNCAFNADAFNDNGRINIIEIGARAGATCIPELIEMHYGIDYYRAILLSAMGEMVSFEEIPDKKPCTARLLMSPVDGEITNIDEGGLEELRASGINISLDHEVGQRVEAMQNATNRIGQFLAASDDQKQIDDIENNIYRHIYVDGSSLEELWER